MIFIKDKLLIFIILLSLYLLTRSSANIVPVLTIIIISGLNTYLNRFSFYIGSMIFYLFLCAYHIDFIYFSPLIIYDISDLKESRLLYAMSIGVILLFFYLGHYDFMELFPFFLAYSGCIYLKHKSTLLNTLTHTHYHSQNQFEEITSLLTQKNKALLEKQDSDIHIATLNERNRIAREIHDNVGHLLSRCLLQIGAIMTLTSKEEISYKGLEQIKQTLTEAMNSIRSSVHDLHDEALDLETELGKLITTFKFCHITLDYDFTTSPPKELKYSFIAIVKEALANVMKHSHATQVEITVHEHPGFYQLIIKDNDLNCQAPSSDGIGIHNMQERITNLNGQFSIDTTGGFKIFISVPKITQK